VLILSGQLVLVLVLFFIFQRKERELSALILALPVLSPFIFFHDLLIWQSTHYSLWFTQHYEVQYNKK